ncbi:hypothetical protein Q3G72_014410 [Acer saccharum]|nr:hypothetical protein Q3G72_014410 [Acer saccharum]
MSHHEPEITEVQQNADDTVITIKPRGFNIVWGKDTRYWQLPEKNRQTETAAELKQVCWLEITGSVDVKAGNRYTIEFLVSMKPDAFGWSGCPVFMMAKDSNKLFFGLYEVWSGKWKGGLLIHNATIKVKY